jgi:hypothetical protein
MISLPRGETVMFAQMPVGCVLATATRVTHGPACQWVGHDGTLTHEMQDGTVIYYVPADVR